MHIINRTILNKHRAVIVGVLILVAYSMLTYTITNNRILGVITDVISGMAVIGIPLLMFPIFNTKKNKSLNYIYVISRFCEGILMVIGGAFILNPSLEPFRESIYINIHIYFFILGALLFYLLLYRTQAIPKFISIWGVIATIILLIITVLRLFDINSTIVDALLAPMVLNEIFLAIWLITKGFKSLLTTPISE